MAMTVDPSALDQPRDAPWVLEPVGVQPGDCARVVISVAPPLSAICWTNAGWAGAALPQPAACRAGVAGVKLPAQVKVFAPVESDHPSAASQVKLAPAGV